MKRKKQPRIHLSDTEKAELFAEVKGLCPLCGGRIVDSKHGKSLSVNQIAHIYPHSPTPAQMEALQKVPKPTNVESCENLIPLCLRCHKLQDTWTTAEDYLKLYAVKQKASREYKALQELAEEGLESELCEIIDKLEFSSPNEWLELSEKPLRVERKIATPLLQKKVLNNVTQYYEFLKLHFQELDAKQTSRFTLVANRFRSAFLKLKSESLISDSEDIFNHLVQWVQSKTGKRLLTCEIVVSFFVQNCEVFDEIA